MNKPLTAICLMGLSASAFAWEGLDVDGTYGWARSDSGDTNAPSQLFFDISTHAPPRARR